MYVYDGDSIYAPLIAVFRWAPASLNGRAVQWRKYVNDLGTLWHCFKSANKFVLVQSNDSTYGQTMDPIIAGLPQYSNNRKKILQLLTLSLNATSFSGDLFCTLLFFSLLKNNLQACGWNSFIPCKFIKNSNATIFYQPPTYSNPLRLISC